MIMTAKGIIILQFLQTIVSSKLTPLGLYIPRTAHYNSNVTMMCKYNLGTARLQTVNWYKDDLLFFTFFPNKTPPTQSLEPYHFHIDESKTDMHKITLLKVTKDHTGNYMCEVNSEQILKQWANMTVFAYPDRNPIIQVEKLTYLCEEEITANCSSGHTIPPALLIWFINGIKVDKKNIIKEEIKSSKGFFRKYSTIKFKIDTNGDRLILECAANVLSGLPVTRTSVSVAIGKSHGSYGHSNLIFQREIGNNFFALCTILVFLLQFIL